MAENSRSVKTWCVSIVAALLLFSSKTTSVPWLLLFLPILPLVYLDMYYLALETFYRIQYNELVEKYKNGKLDVFNVYDLKKPETKNLGIFFQIKSLSILPFYGLLLFICVLVAYLINSNPNLFKI